MGRTQKALHPPNAWGQSAFDLGLSEQGVAAEVPHPGPGCGSFSVCGLGRVTPSLGLE